MQYLADSRFSGPAIMPMMDEILMIHPRSPEVCGSWASICARAYLQPRNTDLVFTRSVVSQVSSSVKCSTAGLCASILIPALLTKLYIDHQSTSRLESSGFWKTHSYISSLPYSFTAACTSVSICTASPTSVCTKIAWPPLFTIKSCVVI